MLLVYPKLHLSVPRGNVLGDLFILLPHRHSSLYEESAALIALGLSHCLYVITFYSCRRRRT